MRNAKRTFRKLMYPPTWALILIPALSFTVLIFLFASGNTECAPAYLIYCMSAYSLAVWVAALPKLVKRIGAACRKSKAMQMLSRTTFGGRYLHDLAFRGNISLYQGMTVNFFYVVFRTITGIRYASVWFLSIAVYYLVLGGLRAYLLIGYRRHDAGVAMRCYRRTAWFLLLLNIPMGGMIVLMVLADSCFSYPGYILYLSALYTFYAITQSILHLVKFRRLGNPILSAAKVLNFVSAMMSILGLQTAMISRFSENGENYRRMMNAITGGCVWGVVIILAFYMLFHSRKRRKQAETVE